MVAIGLALVAAPVLVAGDVWDEPRVVDFRSSPAQIGLVALVGAAALAALTLAFRRDREWLPLAALAVLPLRVPIEVGGEAANLLVPLYVVIAAGYLASLGAGSMQQGAGRPQAADRGPQTEGPTNGERRTTNDPTLWVRWTLAATLALYAIQSLYSEDVPNAVENIGFFLVPFAILFCLLADVKWTRRLLGRALAAVAAVASICAAIAIYQWLARDLFLNPELFDANELHVYFRANSLFFDPNILGRYMALVLTALGAYLAWPTRLRIPVLVVAGLCLAGLALSFSITSFAALLLGLGLVALLRWGVAGAAAAAGLGLAGLAVLLIAGGTPTSDIQTDRSIDSGHASLIEGGLELAGDRPIAGFGSGSFGAAFYDRIEQARTTVSHSEPITVAAEQGAIGIVVYVALLGSAVVALLGSGAGSSLARTAVAGCFITLLVHSFGYTGFAIDPATWALLALGISLRRDPPAEPATI